MRPSRPCSLVALAAALHLAAPASAWAQAAPKNDLTARAEQLFEDQQYEESIQVLSAALLRPSNTRAQKVEIYRLLSLDFITLGKKEEAESAVRALLALEPAYELPRSESPRFRDFFSEARKKWESEGRPGMEAAEAPVPVTLQHASPSQVDPSAQLPLTVRLVDPSHKVAKVVLFYRTGAKGRFTEVVAAIEEDAARASIPGSAVKPPLVEYYFEGLDKTGLPVATRGDSTVPLRVVVSDPSRGWVMPVVIGGGILVAAAAVLGGLALGGAFKGGTTAPGPGPGPGGTPGTGESRGVVNVSIRE